MCFLYILVPDFGVITTSCGRQWEKENEIKTEMREKKSQNRPMIIKGSLTVKPNIGLLLNTRYPSLGSAFSFPTILGFTVLLHTTFSHPCSSGDNASAVTCKLICPFIYLHIFQTVRHGFPYQPSSMAFDPVQKILAIGTQSGALRLYPFSCRWALSGCFGLWQLLWVAAFQGGTSR